MNGIQELCPKMQERRDLQTVLEKCINEMQYTGLIHP